MYSRFDTEARIAVAQATDIARELGHREVGPDHLLLGLLANMRGTAYAALTDHGLRLDAARELVATHHIDTEVDTGQDPDQDTDTDTDTDQGGAGAEPDGLREDREALRAIGIDLDRVRAAVRANLGADLSDGWGERPERGSRGRGRGRRGERGERRRDRSGHHGRGRRGPRSRGPEGPRFSTALRDVLRDVRHASHRDRLDRFDRDAERGPGARRGTPGMTGRRLALAVLGSDDPVVREVLATATDLDGLRAALEAEISPTVA